MMLRSHRFHIGLFLLVYAVCLLHYWSNERPRPLVGVVFESMRSTAHVSLNNGDEDVSSLPLPERVESLQTVPLAIAPIAKEQIEPITPLAETDQLPEETVKEVSDLSVQATSAAVSGERAKAIVRLRNAAKTPESIQALSSVLSGDQSAQNRMFAVAALLHMGRQDDADGTVRTALRKATADYDPRVAMRASQALESLSGPIIATE